jgi:hypothetical protein
MDVLNFHIFMDGPCFLEGCQAQPKKISLNPGYLFHPKKERPDFCFRDFRAFRG